MKWTPENIVIAWEKNDIVTCDEGTYRIYDYFFADYLARMY